MSNSPAEQIPVKIKVHTSIQNGEEKETFELITFGRYYQKNSSSYLLYEENSEEGQLKTTIKLTDHEMLLMRTGSIKMRMLLEAQKSHHGSYTTPFGELKIVTETKELRNKWDEQTNKGSIEVLYDLIIQGSTAGTYQLQISFEEEKG